MAFKIEWSEEALRQLYGLSHDDAKRLVKKLDEAAKNPAHFFKRLTGRYEWKLRIGDYRLIARISPSKESISVVTLGHRKNMYK